MSSVNNVEGNATCIFIVKRIPMRLHASGAVFWVSRIWLRSLLSKAAARVARHPSLRALQPPPRHTVSWNYFHYFWDSRTSSSSRTRVDA
ncbi:hypothetical protein CPB86DRAFT_562081 [Serendipita vermifera]|nr:hypothetical protein CPB86DRAFT_562081 [Serendipita vermifera]